MPSLHFSGFLFLFGVLSLVPWHLLGSASPLLFSTRKPSLQLEQTQVSAGCTSLCWEANGTDGSEVQDSDSGFISRAHISTCRPPAAFHFPALIKPVRLSLSELLISLGIIPDPPALGITFSDIKSGRKKEALHFSLLLMRISAHAVPE